MYDASKQSTEQLLRSYRFHERDLTQTMEQECRRMFLLHEIGTELQRRGITEHFRPHASQT